MRMADADKIGSGIGSVFLQQRQGMHESKRNDRGICGGAK